MTASERRLERSGEGRRGEREKGRLIQERDRLGLAIVGVNRVVRERSLREVLFPGRDDATFGNRVWELARELQPVGAYWRVHRRVNEDGTAERYLSLTDVGYRQAEVLLGARWFPRSPTEELRPSHVLHDLDLGDLSLALLPRRTEEYQPRARGKPTGPPIRIQVATLPRRWRWYHASVFRRLTVIRARDGERPVVALAFEPDAILETDAFNCTRYFIEYDRGTEPVAGAKERRTIADKLRRIREYFWVPQGLERPGAHWTQRRSYHLDAFAGAELRRPKCLFVTRSPKRAENMRRLAVQVLGDVLPESRLPEFLEVLTIEDARAQLRRVTENAELCSGPPAEMPWVAELRQLAAAEAARARTVPRPTTTGEPARPAMVASRGGVAPKPTHDGGAAWRAAEERRRVAEEEYRRRQMELDSRSQGVRSTRTPPSGR
jgi:hypothetical protein